MCAEGAQQNRLDTDKSFSEAVEVYLSQADYLGDDDLPLVIALKQAAAALDADGVQAALLNTFGVTYRALAKRKGGQEGTQNEAEAFLDGL